MIEIQSELPQMHIYDNKGVSVAYELARIVHINESAILISMGKNVLNFIDSFPIVSLGNRNSRQTFLI